MLTELIFLVHHHLGIINYIFYRTILLGGEEASPCFNQIQTFEKCPLFSTTAAYVVIFIRLCIFVVEIYRKCLLTFFTDFKPFGNFSPLKFKIHAIRAILGQPLTFPN